MSKLTQEYIKSLFNYSDGFLFWKVNRNVNKTKGNKAGTLSKSNGYYQIKINSKACYMHRLIFLYHHGYLPNFIDHIDCNKINNNIENLRVATKSQNGMNRKPHKNTSSKYKGVSWNKSANKWIVNIRINGKQIYLGLFTDEKEAAIKYNKAAIKCFGKFANLNK